MSQNKDLSKSPQQKLSAESSPEKSHFIPSPFLTRRNRTFSATRSANEGPSYHGVCASFSQARGHGFIQPDEEEKGKVIFLHVSDVDSEYVPLPGDKVSYKLAPIPPKMEKFQAVEVQIVNFDPSKHHRWNSGE